MRIPGAQIYQKPPQTTLGNALMRIPGAQTYLTPPRTNIELVRAQSLPPVPHTPNRSMRSRSMHSRGQYRSPSANPQDDSELLSPHAERSRSYIEERLFADDPAVIVLMRQNKRELDARLLVKCIAITTNETKANKIRKLLGYPIKRKSTKTKKRTKTKKPSKKPTKIKK